MPSVTNPVEERAFNDSVESEGNDESTDYSKEFKAHMQELENEQAEEENVVDEKTLETLTRYLLPLREEAVKYRQESGIEEVWTLCEERYNGIDDANRHEFKQLKLVKPTTMNAPLTLGSDHTRSDEIKSTVFVRLTSRYVDAAAAKLGEIVLSGAPFAMTPTPLQELEEGKEDETPIVENGQPLMRDAQPSDVKALPPGSAVPAEGQEQPDEVPVTTKDVVAEHYAKAHTSCKKAEKRILDWLIESKYNRQLRKVIRDSARLGVGVVKGPYPDRIVKKKMLKSSATPAEGQSGEEEGKSQLQILEKISPVVGWRDPWNIFPDPCCGDSISEGDHIWERDHLSVKRVRGLKKKGYIKTAINKVIELGPGGGGKVVNNGNPIDDSQEKAKKQFEVWYFTGMIDRTMFRAANPQADELLKEGVDEVYAIVTIINDIVVKAVVNPLHSGELNYHSFPWLPRGTHWAGVGPNEQMSTPQKICNGATRAMLNNAGISSGGQIVIDQEAVVPANGDWRVAANKIWYKTSDGVVDDVRKAFTTFEIPNRVNELLKIIDFSMRLAEESTNIPLVTQGQSGDTTPNTLGAVDIQNNNANQLLRDVANSYDENLGAPLIDQHYEWLLLDPEVPDDEKDEWQIDAHVSVAKVERSIQDQTLAQILPLTSDPGFGIDPKKAFAVFMRSKKIEPSDVQYSADELKKMESAPKPPETGVQIAQIKSQIADKQMQTQMAVVQAEGQLQKELAQLDLEGRHALEQLRNETAQLRVKLDTDRDTVYVETQRAKAQADYQHAIKKLELERELALMDYASKHEITLEQVKGKLAETAMKLRTQKEISAAGMAVDVHTNRSKLLGKSEPSPIEIPGRAPKGQGFEK